VVGSQLSGTNAQHNDRHADGGDEVEFALFESRKLGYPRQQVPGNPGTRWREECCKAEQGNAN
jgi:hypothetical protein